MKDRFGGLLTGGRVVWVLVGLCVMTAAIALYADSRNSEEGEEVAVAQLHATADQSAEIAAGLLAACDGPAGVELRERGLCQRAAQVQAQPIAGPRGPIGDTGATGATGARGPVGPAPPCMSEPRQCRGEDGRDGVDGKDGRDGVDGQNGKDGVDGQSGKDGATGATGATGDRGPAGASCAEGETRQPYTFPDGAQGSRCVGAAPPAEDPAPVENP